jgi:hypothetical protein
MDVRFKVHRDGANVTGTLGISGISTTNTILPITDAIMDLGSNDARWNTTYSRTFDSTSQRYKTGGR